MDKPLPAIIILYEALNEVFDEYQSYCLDNEIERTLLKGLIFESFSRRLKENEVKTNESTD